MKPEVETAIGQLEAAEMGSAVRILEDPDGGAYVVLDDVTVGDHFVPSSSWIGFHIAWSYPDADVYPHFANPDLRYVGSGPAPNQYSEGNLPTGITRGATMPGFNIRAIQISRRSNRRDAETDSALLKLIRVVDFLESR